MIDISKPYACRNGCAAGAMAGPDGRLFGWVTVKRGSDVASPLSWTWYADGRAWPDDGGEFDLVNVPEQRSVTLWFNIYEPQFDYGQWALTREEVDLAASILAHCGHRRTAC